MNGTAAIRLRRIGTSAVPGVIAIFFLIAYHPLDRHFVLSAVAADVAGALNYIESRQLDDGSWNNSVRDGVEILKILHHLGRGNTPVFDRGIRWFRSRLDENTDVMARKIEGLSLAGQGSVEDEKLIKDLAIRQDAAGGWGEGPGKPSDSLSTFLVIRALLTANFGDPGIIDRGFIYLLRVQNTNGSWGITTGSKESIFLTASILSIFTDHRERIDRLFSGLGLGQGPSTDRAVAWLLSKRRADGGWGDDAESAIQETALTYLALLKNGASPVVLDGALNFLSGKADPTKWYTDAYLTAEAIRALSTATKSDLVVRSVEFVDEFPAAGDTINAKIRVANEGRSAVASAGIAVKDENGSPVVTAQPVSNLAGGAVSEFAFQVPAGSEGAHLLTVVVDPANQVVETTKGNNTLTKEYRTLSRPDLEVDPNKVEMQLVNDLPVPNDRLLTGMNVTVRAVISNLGEKPLTNIPVRFVLDNTPLSKDAVIPNLAGFSQTVVEFPWAVNVAAGPHNLFVMVDPDRTLGDFRTNNNEAWVQVVIGDRDVTPPSAPLGLKCSIDESRKATLSWALNREADVSGYGVYRNGVVTNLANIVGDAEFRTEEEMVLPGALFSDGDTNTGMESTGPVGIRGGGRAFLVILYKNYRKLLKMTITWKDAARVPLSFDVYHLVNGQWSGLYRVTTNKAIRTTVDFKDGLSAYALLIYVQKAEFRSATVGIGEIEIREMDRPELQKEPTFSEVIDTLPVTYTVTTFDFSGNQSSHSLPCHIEDNVPPLTEITYPREGDAISDFLQVEGTAYDAFFKNYRIEIVNSATGQRLNLFEGQTAVRNGILGEVRVNNLSAGSYVLKLVTEDVRGNRSEDALNVSITGASWGVTKIVATGGDKRASFPNWSPDGSEIVFGWDTVVFDAIWKTQSAAVNSPVQVTLNYTGDRDPAWRPIFGSQEIVFSTNPGDGFRRIFRQDVGTSTRTQLTFGNQSFDHAEWSYDGAQIVMTGADKQIYVMNADGSGVRKVTADGVNDFPAWSASGQHIVYQSVDTSGFWKIRRIDAIGSDSKQITYGEWNDEHPSYFSDGKSIVYVSEKLGRRELCVIDSEGVYPPSRITSLDRDVRHSRASARPGPRKIVFNASDGIYLAEYEGMVEATLQSDVTAGPVPLTVNFTVGVSDQRFVASYEWDFDGDGVTDGASPVTGDTVHTYTYQGTYEAKLRVVDAKGRETLKTSVIVVRGPPEISIRGMSDGAIFMTSVQPEIIIRDDNLKTSAILLNGLPFSPGSIIEKGGFYTLDVRAEDFDAFVVTRRVSFTVAPMAEPELFDLLRTDIVVSGPAWSPAGDKIVFSSQGQLFVADAGRFEPPRQITSGAGVKWSPAWSPVGQQVAFVSAMSQSNKNIWVQNIDGSGLRQITFFEQPVNSPSWSPDGQKLVFGVEEAAAGEEVAGGDLYVVDAQSLRLEKLYDDAAHPYGRKSGDPDWFPTENLIAARFFDPGGETSTPKWTIGIIDPRDTRTIKEVPSEFSLLSPSWGPDGTFIVAVEPGRSGGVIDRKLIKVVPVAGGGAVYLTGGDISDEPAWSRTGTRIAFHTKGHLKGEEINTLPVIRRFGPASSIVNSGSPVIFDCEVLEFFKGRIVRYEFDFEGDGQIDLTTDTCAGVSHVYATGGIFSPLMRAIDHQGASAETSAALTVRGPPTLAIRNVTDRGSYFGFVMPHIYITDDNLTVQDIRLDGSPYTSGTPIAEAGPHDLVVFLRDADGNEASRRLVFYVARNEAIEVANVNIGNPVAGATPLWLDTDTNVIVQILNGTKNGLARVNVKNPLDVVFITPAEENVFSATLASDQKTLFFHKPFSEAPFARIVASPISGPYTPVQITDNLTTATEPSVSPDSRWIAYSQGGDLYLLNRFTGNSRKIASSAGTEQRPRFSPQGNSIAFSSNRTGNYDIYVYGMESGQVTRITTAPADEIGPAWSSDGSKIYFHSTIGGRGQLSVADPQARVSPIQLFADESSNLFPAPSPDGTKVAYVVSGKLRIVRPRADFTGPIVNIDTPAASAVLTTVSDVVVTSPDSDVARVVLNARLQRETVFRQADEIVLPQGEIVRRFPLKLNTNNMADGAYVLQAAATDRFDNPGNAVVEVVVNNQLPDLTELAFKVLSDVIGSDAVSSVQLTFRLSEESRIELTVKSRDGAVVRAIQTGFLFPQIGAEQAVTWDQRNSFGSIVNEDTYVFELRVVDRADIAITVKREFRVPGFFRPVSAISTGRTPVSVAVGDNVRVRQSDAVGVTVLDRTASDSIFVWDGRDRFGAISPIGSYKVSVNGGPETSVALEVDAASPQIIDVSLSDIAFAPLAGDTVSVSYRANEYCPNVVIQFQAEGNKTVKEFVRKGSLSFGRNDTATWDGIDINNNVAPPGKYSITIQATDAAGNKTMASGGSVTVDGPPKILRVNIDTPPVISPNADFVDDTRGIEIQVSEAVAFDVMIYSASNVLVDNIRGEISSGTGMAVWDGRTGPDRAALAAGFYNVAIEVTDRDGLMSRNSDNFIEIVSVPPIGAPEITEVNDFPDPFSPNGDGVADSLAIAYRVSDTSDAVIRIFNSSNFLVRKLTVSQVSGSVVTPWNGRDGAEQTVPNGLYTYRIQAEKNSGRLKSLEKGGQALVFNPPVEPGPAISAIRISPDPFSPNNDGQDEATNVTITLTAGASVTVDVFKNALLVNRLADGVSAPQGESVYVWNGKDSGGVVQPDAVYTVRVTAVDVKGFKTTLDGSVQINTLLSNDTPIVSSVTATPTILFSDGDTEIDSVTVRYQLSEDATVNLVITNDSGNVVLRNVLVNKFGFNSILWDGADTHGTFLSYDTYQIDLTAVDRFGLVSETRSLRIPQKSFRPVIFGPILDRTVVSPDEDGVLDTLGVTFFLSEAAGFTVGVVNVATRQRIAEITGVGVAGANRAVWDGRASDGLRPMAGQYVFTFDAIDRNGSGAERKTSSEFAVDYPPKVVSVTAQPAVFSPNGDRTADTVQISVTSDKAEFFVTLHIYLNSSNALVRTLANTTRATSGQFTMTWDGRGADGKVVDNGIYRFEIQLTHVQHSVFKSPVFTGIVEVDNPLELHRLFQSVVCFTPNENLNDGDDVLRVEYTINLGALATVTVFNASNKPVKTIIANNTFRPRGDNSFTWDGTGDTGAVVADGVYRIDFHFSEGGDAIDTSISVCKLRMSPLASIDFPAEGDTISGNVVIRGFAAAVEPIDLYEVLVGFEDTRQGAPTFVTMKTLASKSTPTPVFGGDLAEWPTNQLKNARYVVRINVRAGGTKSTTDTTVVFTNNVTQLPFNVVTPGETTAIRTSKFVTGKVAWSPAGNELLFEDDGKLSVINTDGSNLITLNTGIEVPALAPVWDSPSNQIVFHKGNAGDALFIRPPVGTVNTPINVGFPAPIVGDISPDGTKIAFTAIVGPNNPEIFVVNVGGGAPVRLTNDLVGNPWFDDNPTFSPDGQKIAFSSNRGSTFDIWVVDVATRQLMQLTDDPGNELFPNWSKDGRQIVYESHE